MGEFLSRCYLEQQQATKMIYSTNGTPGTISSPESVLNPLCPCHFFLLPVLPFFLLSFVCLVLLFPLFFFLFSLIFPSFFPVLPFPLPSFLHFSFLSSSWAANKSQEQNGHLTERWEFLICGFKVSYVPPYRKK